MFNQAPKLKYSHIIKYLMHTHFAYMTFINGRENSNLKFFNLVI